MKVDLPILYSFRRCPYVMRARMALLASGCAVNVHEVALSDKPAALRLASPKATVPVLVLADGGVIDESCDIMRWCLGVSDPENWLGVVDADLIATNDGAFKRHLDRYKYAMPGADREAHRAAGFAFLAGLELRLAGTANLCRDRLSFTDIALMPFVRQFAAIDRGWFGAQPLPLLQAWLAALETSTSFLAAMQRFPVGQLTRWITAASWQSPDFRQVENAGAV